MEKIQYYKGIRFVRYEGQNYYVGSIGGGHVLLHRFVWLCENGEIPKGYDVHHIDHDVDNNDISNLQLLSRSNHFKLHFSESSDKFKAHIRDNMLKARFSEKCIAYHTSPEGRLQKSNTVSKLWADGKMSHKEEFICEVCGKKYVKTYRPAKHRFCSNKCRFIFELPSVEKKCKICGKMFISNPGSIATTCSISCARKMSSQTKKDN